MGDPTAAGEPPLEATHKSSSEPTGIEDQDHNQQQKAARKQERCAQQETHRAFSQRSFSLSPSPEREQSKIARIEWDGSDWHIVYVKEQLGHSSIQVTVDNYGHLIPGANRAALDALPTRIPDASDPNEATVENGSK